MHVMITGVAGFIGFSLAKKLLDQDLNAAIDHLNNL